MSAFDLGWLQAREPLDHAARSGPLAERFAAGLGARPRLLDLGSGTGSNIRYLTPRLRGAPTWLALDHDPALLDAMGDALEASTAVSTWVLERQAGQLILHRPGGQSRITSRQANLADAETWPALAEADAVTASALLDLTSAAWLDKLAAEVASRRVPALFALSFDGRMSFVPARPADAEVRARFARHQRTDKGFGPALGPAAVMYLAGALERRGGKVELVPSDWHLGPACRRLTGMFLDGLEVVMAASPGADLRPWCADRREQLERGLLQIVVGHQDLLVL